MIVFCAVVDKVPLNVPPSTVPAIDKFCNPLMLVNFAVDELIVPASTVPATDKFCNPLMFVNFAVDELNVPASTVPATDKFCNPLMLVRFATAELKVPAVTVPLTVMLDALIAFATVRFCTLPRLVIVFCAVVDKVPLNVPPSTVPAIDKFCNDACQLRC